MNGKLLAKAVGRILSERSGKEVTVRVTSCRNCTHIHSCKIESDRGPCKDYEDSYGGNNQTQSAEGKQTYKNDPRKPFRRKPKQNP